MFGLFEVHFDYYKFTKLVCASLSFTHLQDKARTMIADDSNPSQWDVGLIDASEEEDNVNNSYYVILPIEVLV